MYDKLTAIVHSKTLKFLSSQPPLLYAALGAVIGFYFLSKTFLGVIIFILIFFLFGYNFFKVLSSFNTQSRILRELTNCGTAFVIALFFGLSASDAAREEINFGIPIENITAIEGVLLEDPRMLTNSILASVSLTRSAGSGGLRVTSSGEITIFFPREISSRLREYGRGTTVFAEGRLRSSRERGYTFAANSLHVVKTAPPVERMRTGIRLNLIERFGKHNWGSLSLALLFGVKDNLDSELSASYRNAGLSYVLALSGMHLAIIAALISFILKKPLGLKACALAGAIFVVIYCLFVGPMPSLIRASIMYLLGVAAVLWSLPRSAIRILALSFLLQIFFTPGAGNSISFILSYLALFGILTIGVSLHSIFSGKFPDFILQPACASIGAFLVTAGICAFTFGVIAPIGIIAGLLVVPLTTVFMIGSIIWLFLDLLSISFILNFPMSLLYRLTEWIASVAGGVPGFSAGNSFVVLAVSLLLSILIIIYEYRKRRKRNFVQLFA